METIQQDTDWLFNKLGLEKLREDWEKVVVGRIKPEPSSEVLRQYFGEVSKQDIVRLYNKYKVDFIMFDYEKQLKHFIDMGR